jgi:hypothetical protein
LNSPSIILLYPAYPHSLNSFSRSHFSIYIHVYTVFALYSPSCTLSPTFSLLPLLPTPRSSLLLAFQPHYFQPKVFLLYKGFSATQALTTLVIVFWYPIAFYGCLCHCPIRLCSDDMCPCLPLLIIL